MRISIIPGPSSIDNADEKERWANLLVVSRPPHLAPTILLASEIMGLPRAGATGLDKIEMRFSDNALKVVGAQHLSDASYRRLSRNGSNHLSNQEGPRNHPQADQGLYLGPPYRYPAVMNASNNLASQEVFKMARGVDPRGDRTVGIITKCDVVQTGDEPGVGDSYRAKLGGEIATWMICCSQSLTFRDQAGVSLKDRHATERQFFMTSPLCDLRSTTTMRIDLRDKLGRFEEARRIAKTI
ncbi:hypothetical protein ABEF93_001977 [Exophiala dermatitidis]